MAFNHEKSRIAVTHDGHTFFLSADRLLHHFPGQDPVQLVAKEVCKHNADTAKLFAFWLNFRVLESLDLSSDKIAKGQLLSYIKLYKLVRDCKTHKLMNEIMDNIRDRPTCGEGYFPVFFVNECYKSSTPGDPLRRYLVDTFIFKTMSWDNLKRVKLIKRHMDASHHNQTFVVDCDAKKTKNMKLRLTGRDPNKNDRCEYHVHAPGKRCR